MTTEQKAPPAPPPTDTRAEIAAMGKAYEVLRTLDRAAQLRAMTWLGDRLAAEDRRGNRGPWDEESPF